GPDGSRSAVMMARLAAELGAGSLALAALARAMKVDGDIEEFAGLSDLVPALAANDAAAAWLESVREQAEKPYSSVGAPLLGRARELALAGADRRAAAALLVHAVRHAPDDDALVCEADALVSASLDESLRDKLEQAFPAKRRVEAMLALADARE